MQKREARKISKKSELIQSVCMDFQKNLPLPNISTNDVYYKRQLSFYSFNIHQLLNNHSVFYAYTEVIGKKGANEVVTFLNHYIKEELDEKVKQLNIFCDSCSGQNKNFVLMKYLHYIVHRAGRLDKIQVTFPIRGHSYMKCDKNMGLVKTKTVVETPNEWIKVFQDARKNPCPFKVVEVEQEMIRDWTEFFNDKLYVHKCPFKTRPIKEVKVEKDNLQILHRSTYNGAWISSSLLTKPRQDKRASATENLQTTMNPGEFFYPQRAYNGK